MGMKLGAAVGFAAGYYFGAKAGRARYEQLDAWIAKARQTDLVEQALDRAKAVADLGVERAREMLDADGTEPEARPS